MSRFVTLLLFLVVVVGGGTIIGINNAVGEWYQALQKPPFNPPNWVFGPVWTLLYIMIAVAGWRVWHRLRTGGAMTSWWLQLGLNFLWSPTFFTLQRPGAALVIILALLATVLVFIGLAWSRDRLAALLFVPYAAWVAFATLLNGAIWWLN
jgi:benzodiazapine receptor